MARTVIVGAGPAGLMATVAAHQAGCAVTLIDEAPRPGGQIYRQPAAALGDKGFGLASEQARKAAVLQAFAQVADSIDYRPGCTAYAIYPGPELHIALPDETSEVLRPDALILATGVSERAVPFPGWTLPGVLYAGGVQATLKAQQIRAGDRVVVIGAGPLPIAVAAQLAEAGASVACVALLRSFRSLALQPSALWAGREILQEGFTYLRVLRRARVPILQGWGPLKAEGTDRVEALTLARLDGRGALRPGSERRIEVDLVAMNYGFTANSELARMAAAEMHFEPAGGGWIPRADGQGRTSVEGLFVAGDGAGLRGALVAAAEGSLIGSAAAAFAQGYEDAPPAGTLAERARHLAFQRAIRPTLELPPGVWSWADTETLICRCEGVTRARLERALADGHHSLDAAKKNTRVGMGWCGGRTCLQSVAHYAAEGRPGAATPAMHPRPLARPVTLQALANRDGDR